MIALNTSSLNKPNAFWLLALLVVLSTVVYWDFLTFADLYLYKDIGSDTLNVFYPGYVHMADYLRTDGWPTWSFAQGMGQNIFPGSIMDPLNLILVLLGPENLAYGLVYVQVARVLLAGLLFFFYARLISLEPLTALLGALFYAFSSFMILGGTWYVFSAQAVYFVLLLYGFECYLKHRDWRWFLLGIAFVAALTPFYLYSLALFFLPYALFRFYIENDGFNRELPRFLTGLAGFAVLGVGISAVFLFAKLQQMINSPRVLGDASFFGDLLGWGLLDFASYEHNLTAVMRLFSSDLLGTGSEFRGWRNYLEAPMFYCGLLPLLLAPQVLPSLDPKKRIAYVLFGALLLTPVLFPFFRYLLSAFAGDYYRLYSLFVAFVFLYFGLQALNVILRTNRVQPGWLIASLLVLVVMLFSPYLLGPGAKTNWLDDTLIWVILGFLIVYSVLVAGLGVKRTRGWATAALVVTVCMELAGFSWITVNDRPVLSAEEFVSKSGYNDYTREAVALIKKNDPGFYRIEKTYWSGPAEHSSINDAKVQGYFGTRSYSSFNQLNYIRFLAELGVIDATDENATRWARGIINYPVLISFSGIKYVLIKRDNLVREFSESGYLFVERVGDVTIMENPQALPFGFTYERFMDEETFNALSFSEKHTALLKAAVVAQDVGGSGLEDMKRIEYPDISPNYDMASYVEDVRQRRSSSLDIHEFRHSRIRGELVLDQPQLLFFTLPFDPGWTATIDGNPIEIQRVNIGFSGFPVPAGRHEIELRYRLPGFLPSLIVSSISIAGLLLFVWRGRRKARVAANTAE